MNDKHYVASYGHETIYRTAPRFESNTYYGMDSIVAALNELEAAMKRDPQCTIWALQGILRRGLEIRHTEPE